MSVAPPEDDADELVGRIKEMHTLSEALAATERGESVTVMVTGEPGIGKTRLLEKVCEQAVRQGFEVGRGRGTELEREIPHGALIEALNQPLGLVRHEDLDALGADVRSELGMLLPTLADGAAPLTTRLEVERHRLHRAVRMALDRVAARRPLLLAIDDVHWADHASIELIAHLIRHRGPRVMLVMTQRPHQTPAAQAVVLARATRDGALISLELGPLTPREAADLLRDRTDMADLYRECGGNPFYLQELARASVRFEAPAAQRTALPGSADVPAAVRAALEQELRALSSTSRQLLQAGAIAGEPFELKLAAEIAELDEAMAWPAVDESVESGLVRDSGIPGHLVFRHPIVRRAIYDQAGPQWQRSAHRRAAVALARRGAALGVRAHHVAQCADIGDEPAIALLIAAGAEAAPRAPMAAAQWFRDALALLPGGAAEERRPSLSMALAEALAATGRLGESGTVLRQALDLLPSDAVAARGRFTALIARIEQELGNAVEARRLLTAALANAASGTVETAALQLVLAKNHVMMRDWGEAARTANDVRVVARRNNDRRLYLIATATSAYLGQMQCGAPLIEALADLDEAAAVLDALTDSEVAPTLLDGLTNVVYAEVCFERWDSAIEHGERGIRLCRSIGHGTHLAEIMHLQSTALMMRGRLGEALRTIDAAVETALLLDNDPLVALTGATRCWVLGLLGRTNDALAAGIHSIELGGRTPQAIYAWHAQMVYGSTLVDAGQWRRGRREIITAGGDAALSEVYPSILPHFYRFLVDAELALGLLDAAEETTSRIEAIAEKTPVLHMRIGDAHFARSGVLLARDEVSAALRSAQCAVTEYETSGTRVDAARARLLAGKALVGAGEMTAAGREFDAALATFELCGAAGLAERARRAMRKMDRGGTGRSSRSHAAVGELGDLTARQTEIVRRVASGHTNRRISEELFLSEKSVEAHLTRLFAKLGVSSRAELAAVVAGVRHRPRLDR